MQGAILKASIVLAMLIGSGFMPASAQTTWLTGYTDIGPSLVQHCDIGATPSCSGTRTIAQGTERAHIQGVSTFGRIGLMSESSASYSRLEAGLDTGTTRAVAQIEGGFSDRVTLNTDDGGTRGRLTFATDWSFTPTISASTANAATSTHLLASQASISIEARVRLDIAGTALIRSFSDSLNQTYFPSSTIPLRFSRTRGASIDGNDVPPDSVTWRRVHAIDVPLNTPFELSARFLAFSSVGAGGIAQSLGSVNSLDSLNWGGIVSLEDSAGRPIDFTPRSLSGTDWISPVPEPSTVLLGLVGLTLEMGVARRRAPIRGATAPSGA